MDLSKCVAFLPVNVDDKRYESKASFADGFEDLARGPYVDADTNVWFDPRYSAPGEVFCTSKPMVIAHAWAYDSVLVDYCETISGKQPLFTQALTTTRIPINEHERDPVSKMGQLMGELVRDLHLHDKLILHWLMDWLEGKRLEQEERSDGRKTIVVLRAFLAVPELDCTPRGANGGYNFYADMCIHTFNLKE